MSKNKPNPFKDLKEKLGFQFSSKFNILEHFGIYWNILEYFELSVRSERSERSDSYANSWFQNF